LAEIVNLRLARKARDRSKAEQQAAQNRAKFGQTKAEKAKARAEYLRAEQAIDGAKLDGDGPEAGTD